MKIKVIYKSPDEGGYTIHSPVFPNCIGKGKTKGDALINFHEEIKLHIVEVEKKIYADKNADIEVTNLSEFISKVRICRRRHYHLIC